MSRSPGKPVILGAGIGGIAVAWNLAQNGIACTLIEKGEKPGGLTSTFVDDGFRFDLGPHNLHIKYPDIERFLLQLMGDEMYKLQATAKIIFKGKLVKYPLQGVEVLTALPPLILVPAAINFVYARLKMFLMEPSHDDTFQDWITNRFGKTLYEIYFAPYAKKAWKIPGSEISNYVAIRRVPVISMRDHLRRAVGLKTKLRHSQSGYLENYYMRNGAGALPDKLLKEAGDKVRLLTGRKAVAIRGRVGQVESVVWREADGTLREEETDFVFSTIPLPELIEIMDVDTPADVKEAAAGLDFCAETLVYVKLKGDFPDIPSILYFSDPEIKCNRLYNVGSWSKDCAPPGKSAFCMEYTCEIGDEIWSAPPEEIYDYTEKTLTGLRLVKKEDIEGFSIRRVEHAYPRFRVGFAERMNKTLDYLAGVSNLITFGRQGLFSYANVDDVLHMAFRSYEVMNTVNVKNIDYHDLYPQYTNF